VLGGEKQNKNLHKAPYSKYLYCFLRHTYETVLCFPDSTFNVQVANILSTSLSL
jgi:hypothetical protein